MTAFDRIGKSKYQRVHYWLYRNYGLASECVHCAVKNKRFEWALKRGCEYDFKFENFIQLCPSCHRKYDLDEDVLRRISIANKGISKPHLYREVIQIAKDYKKEFQAIHMAVSATGVSHTAIANCLSGRSKTAGGFKWTYKNG